jgi:hypothetical protein
MVHAFLLVNILGRAASAAGKFGLFGLEPGGDSSHYLGAIFSLNPLAQVGVFAVYIGLVLGTSALTFRFIERPGRSYFNALAARRREPAAQVAPAE